MAIDWNQMAINAISPFTRNGVDDKGNTKYNWLGTALLGGGVGLSSWALARLLGFKSGASLTAGILGGLGMAHYSLGRQLHGKEYNPFSLEHNKDIYSFISDKIEQRRRINDSLKGAQTIAAARRKREQKEREIEQNLKEFNKAPDDKRLFYAEKSYEASKRAEPRGFKGFFTPSWTYNKWVEETSRLRGDYKRLLDQKRSRSW